MSVILLPFHLHQSEPVVFPHKHKELKLPHREICQERTSQYDLWSHLVIKKIKKKKKKKKKKIPFYC